MLTTLLRPATGTVSVFGVDAVDQPMRVRRMLGYVLHRGIQGASFMAIRRDCRACDSGRLDGSRGGVARRDGGEHHLRVAPPLPPG
jgi:hypothetical protein